MTHFDTLEADFTRYYQIDLPAAMWGPTPLSARRVGSLVRGLPPDSALSRKLDAHPGWGNVEELLATIAELTDIGNRALIGVHTGQMPPETIAIRRPWATAAEKPAMATSQQMVAFFRRTGAI